MRVHANAKLTQRGRLLLVQRIEGGWKVAQAAACAGVSERTEMMAREAEGGAAEAAESSSDG